MHKIPFPLVKLMNVLLLALPFAVCWVLYHDKLIFATGSERITALMMLSFMTICFYFCQKLDCFRISIYQVRDIMLGQVLATMITDACM